MHKTTVFAVRAIFCSVLLLTLSLFAGASDWRLIGPEGGDVRSLAYDPSNTNRILLGTSAGQLFNSEDGGASWTLFAHLAPGDDYVLDHIIFNPDHPQTIYVAGWSLYNADEGDVFRSDDSGKTWRALPGVHGKSVRALAMAPSNSNTLVVGALDGIFRSNDGGQSWQRISPESYTDIRNVESLAIDPQNPDIIYAGTWHLPWKTEDGGATWHSISKGIAFDSDMFSIIIDPHNPQVVYASACSGMYKSLNKAEYFHRIYMSLPTPAHRTRVLKQDPQRPNTVYAGTVAGLWKTLDGGDHWKLVTDDSVVVNDVMINPQNPEHVLVATDRGGVLASNNGFGSYEASNRGFAHRIIGGVVVDSKDPNRIYVGVVNDKDLGGFFFSDDGGSTWRQSNRGLDERDILSLQQQRDGVMFAGTNHGIFFLKSVSDEWEPASMILGSVPQPEAEEKPVTKTITLKSGKKVTRTVTPHPAARKAVAEKAIPLSETPRVLAFDLNGDTWYAATTDGIFVSTDGGHKWYGTAIEGEREFIAVNSFTDGTVAVSRSQARVHVAGPWQDLDRSQSSAVCDRAVRPLASWRRLAVDGHARGRAALARRRQDLGARAGRSAGAQRLCGALRSGIAAAAGDGATHSRRLCQQRRRQHLEAFARHWSVDPGGVELPGSSTGGFVLQRPASPAGRRKRERRDG